MIIPTIRKFLGQPDCIIFVGSGISQWSGLPSWTGLLSELANFLDAEGESSDLVRRETRYGDLLQAASYGFSKLTLAAIATFIRRAVRAGSAEPHAIHKAIVELGPSFFITTNYDRLIEQALAKWKPGQAYPAPITNRHLVELAEILGARASHYVFKQHGDVDDASSIILTREQYRMLLPQGPRFKALEALKTLLISRPVLYVGFGLRDPDFIYLRDLLINIYEGAVRDHWAILPDVGPDEIDYWRRQYGIRLMGYPTHARPDGSRDHRELLTLLEALSPAKDVPRSVAAFGSAERVLAVTRYAAGLARKLTPTVSPIEIRISAARSERTGHRLIAPYENWTVTRFLIEGPETSYLIGAPGAGKSYALRLVAAQLASKLQQACIDDTLNTPGLALPVLIDLKLYRGDLRAQIDAVLPPGFTLQQLLGAMRLKLFLDAYNEMPSQYLEDGSLLTAIDALRGDLSGLDVTITSRTPDGLRRPGSTDQVMYEIDRFDEAHVDEVLHDRRIHLSGPLAVEIRRLLSRPFLLQLVKSGAVDVPDQARPRDIYGSFVKKLDQAFAERFATSLPISSVLSKIAFRAIDEEREAFPLDWLLEYFRAIDTVDMHVDAKEAVNWLVSGDVLISYSGHRASLVHQSITEYYAGLELARQSSANTLSVRDTITSKKWDQCLFLALGLMEKATADALLDHAIECDLQLAINAVRYTEEEQSAAVTRLLTALCQRARGANPMRFMRLFLRYLPVGKEHVPLLKELVQCGNSLGGEAVILVAKVEGEACKEELFELLEQHSDDYNFSVNGVARALMPMLDAQDLPRLVEILVRQSNSGKVQDHGYAVQELLAKFDPDAMLAAAIASAGNPLPDALITPLCRSLDERKDNRSFEILAQFLLSNPKQSVNAFSLRLMRNDCDAVACLAVQHVTAIWSARAAQILWDTALRRICELRPDLRAVIGEMAAMQSGVERIALLYCAGRPDEQIFCEVSKFDAMADTDIEREPFDVFRMSELHWTTREPLYARLLARNTPRLRASLLGDSSSPAKSLSRSVLGLEALRPVIERAVECSSNTDDWWRSRRLSAFIAHVGNAEIDAFCLEKAVDGSARLRHWIKTQYLSFSPTITIDMLDEETIALLLDDLNVPGRINELSYNPLGTLATERFVEERLLPLATGASPEFLNNLRAVLKRAGDRHGRRYLLHSSAPSQTR